MTSSEPPKVTERDIEQAVDEYLKNAPLLRDRFISGPRFIEENLRFNIFGQQKYLLISKFSLPELPIKILRRLPIYLVRQFKIQVELDSKWYWALTKDVSRSHMRSPVLRNFELMRAFETLMAAHFASLSSSYINSFSAAALDRLNRATMDIVTEPVRDLVMNSHIVLMYVCFPVLEGIAKFAMSPLISSDGKILADKLSDGKTIFTKGKHLSSLAKILRCLEANSSNLLAKPEFGTTLRDFRLEVEKLVTPIHKSDDGWDSIYHLRNVALHGTLGWQLRSGLITNLVCLILWHLLDEKEVQKELERIAKMAAHPHFGWGNYYPPEL
jgi:hypothetical protein